MSGRSRIIVLVLAALVIIVGTAVVVSSGGSNRAAHTSGHAHIHVVGGKPRGGVALLVYNRGQLVVLTVDSDVTDEIHIHGYELKKPVARGGSVTFSFRAADVGDHVIELESRGEQIANLRVQG